MAPRPEFSARTLPVLVALCAEPSGWRHGYGIAKQTGLKPGTLYPILIRLAGRGLVEACWEDTQPAGRPRRQLYRLTADGLARARAAVAEAPARPRRRAAVGRGGVRRRGNPSARRSVADARDDRRGFSAASADFPRRSRKRAEPPAPPRPRPRPAALDPGTSPMSFAVH